jgi:hypothetical protein
MVYARKVHLNFALWIELHKASSFYSTIRRAININADDIIAQLHFLGWFPVRAPGALDVTATNASSAYNRVCFVRLVDTEKEENTDESRLNRLHKICAVRKNGFQERQTSTHYFLTMTMYTLFIFSL